MPSLEKPAYCSARTAASASDLPAMTAPMPLCGAALETAAWRSRLTSGAVLPGSIEVLTTVATNVALANQLAAQAWNVYSEHGSSRGNECGHEHRAATRYPHPAVANRGRG